jgi:RNA polymerase sigma-70 factor (ECF subfamily)
MHSALVAKWAAVFGPSIVCAPAETASHTSGEFRRAAEHWSSEPSAESLPPRLTEINGTPVSQLLTALRAGDQGALESIHRALYAQLWHFAAVLTHSAAAADEILQEVFLSLWTRREGLDPASDIRAYLYVAVRNQVWYARRHDHVVAAMETAVDRGTLKLPAFGQQEPGADQVAEAHEFTEAFQRAVATLSERERHALHLRIEDDLTFDEIGRILGVSKMGAHKIVARAEAKLRSLLSEYQP